MLISFNDNLLTQLINKSIFAIEFLEIFKPSKFYIWLAKSIKSLSVNLRILLMKVTDCFANQGISNSLFSVRL